MASTVEQMQEREDFWSSHIDRMQLSGMSHKSYCDEHGLKIHTLRYWTRILGRTNEQKRIRNTDKENHWKAIYDKQLSSGLTAEEFCREQGIPPSSYRNWERKFSVSVTEEVTFAPLTLTESANSTSGVYEVVLGNCILKVPQGFCESEVKKLVGILSC